jgi:glycosyltransferase involved in cell wall biosynthesis
MLGSETLAERPGGLNRYFGELFDALCATGMNVKGVVLGMSSPRRYYLAGPANAPLPTRVIRYLMTTLRRARGVDIVDAHFALYAFAPVLLSRSVRRRLVVHFHGPWAAESVLRGGSGRLQSDMKRRMERFVYSRAAALITLSEAFRDVLVKDYTIDPGRVHVMAPGVNLDLFSPGDRGAARAALGIAPDVFVVVSARRLERRMGLDVLLKAWAGVAATGRHLFIAGEGSERSSLESLASELPQPNGVHFLGRLSDRDLVNLYRAADCSVVPSRSLEGFGLVVLESLACGVPPIVSNIGGLPEALASFDGSLIVQPGDAPALARRLLRATKGDLPSAAACLTLAKRYSWTTTAEAHLRLYAKVTTAALPR